MYKNVANGNIPQFRTFFLRSAPGWIAAVFLGITGAVIADSFDFPIMQAAQTSMGAFGLAVGFSIYLLIRAAGGNIPRKFGLFFSIVWALGCIGGVTPLFFIFGTSLKMATLTFFSFAISGALGAVVTAFMMRSLFANAASRDVIPCVLTWSFSLGLAAVVGDVGGESLQKFMPVLTAWTVSFASMALITGIGSGYSITLFLMSATVERQPHDSAVVAYKTSSKEKNRLYILVLILLLVPFYLNDFSNIYVKDWRLWIFIDYTTVKLFPFLIVLWLLLNRKMQPYEFGFTLQPVSSFIAVFLIGTLAGLFIEQNGYPILKKLSGYPALGGMPEITSHLWYRVDLTFGLLMVGIFEELVFRGYMRTFLSRYTKRASIIIGISAVAFGLIHWSGGLSQVIVTSVAGAIFMAIYLRTRSIPAIMLAHFIVDFIDFTNIIPKNIFSFFAATQLPI